MCYSHLQARVSRNWFEPEQSRKTPNEHQYLSSTHLISHGSDFIGVSRTHKSVCNLKCWHVFGYRASNFTAESGTRWFQLDDPIEYQYPWWTTDINRWQRTPLLPTVQSPTSSQPQTSVGRHGEVPLAHRSSFATDDSPWSECLKPLPQRLEDTLFQKGDCVRSGSVECFWNNQEANWNPKVRYISPCHYNPVLSADLPWRARRNSCLGETLYVWDGAAPMR